MPPTFDASKILDPLYRRIQEIVDFNPRNLMANGRYLTLDEMDAVTASALTKASVKIHHDMGKPKEVSIVCDYAWFAKDELLFKYYKEVERLLPKVPEKAKATHNAAKVVTADELFEELDAQARTIGYKLVLLSHGD